MNTNKTTIPFAVTCLFLGLWFASCAASGQSRDSAAAEAEAHDVMVGAYGGTDANDESVQLAAAKGLALLAEKEPSLSGSSLTKVESAEIQIVAGTNYRLLLVLKNGNDQKRVKLVVYRDLQGNYSLTEYQFL